MKLIQLMWVSLWAMVSWAQSAKVLELSDKFIPLRREGMWLIKFYAPWCGHCKKLEPIFKLVSQGLGKEQDLRIGRVDCTRFPTVANEFGIRGYPTIMFLKGDQSYTYEGDRTRDDIVAFAKRLVGPAVKQISNYKELEQAIMEREINFAFIGSPIGHLWDIYQEVASNFQQHEFFLQIPSAVAEKVTNSVEEGTIRVFKDGTSFRFQDHEVDVEEELERQQRSTSTNQKAANSKTTNQREENLNSESQIDVPMTSSPNSAQNSSLRLWVSKERFPSFVKITRGKFHHLMSTKKLVVMAVLEENKIGDITPDMEDFRSMLKIVQSRKPEIYREHFQFGWTGEPSLANSVAMETLSLPHLIVINSSSYQHFLPDDDPTQLTPEAIQIFLDSVIEGNAPVYGGSTYSVRLYRSYYEAKTSLVDMWRGNPVLTAVLFGLPLGFFSLICYSICCADIMDADEDDDEEEAMLHEKTD